MNEKRNQVFYSKKPIRNIAALALALKLEPNVLSDIAANAELLWKPPYELRKDDGSSRIVFDAKAKLKAVHKRIYTEILSKVIYPTFITGSVKGFDYSSNAAIHTNKAIVITEDIKSFFPNTKIEVIHDIWHKFFNFSEDVATLLTKLTTKDGGLPQGGICSSYLANLVFWDIESELHFSLKEKGIDYSRYVDDITISSKSPLSNTSKKESISAIYGLLYKKGYKPKRSKHEIQTQHKPMIVTKLVVNDKISLSRKERNNIRAAVHQIETRINNGERGHIVANDLTKTSGRVGMLGRFHKREGSELKKRLKTLRKLLDCCPIHNTTFPTKKSDLPLFQDSPF
jgi:hypothetical protein